MTKLDEIVKSHATLNPNITKEIKKLDVKILMLEVYGEALKEAATLAEVAEIYRKKVLAL